MGAEFGSAETKEGRERGKTEEWGTAVQNS